MTCYNVGSAAGLEQGFPLGEKVKWGIAFRGMLHKSALVSDISRLKLGDV